MDDGFNILVVCFIFLVVVAILAGIISEPFIENNKKQREHELKLKQIELQIALYKN